MPGVRTKALQGNTTINTPSILKLQVTTSFWKLLDYQGVSEEERLFE